MEAGFAPAINIAEAVFNMSVFWVFLVVKIFAFVTAVTYSNEAYEAASKQNKATWCAILGIGMVLQFFPLLSIINLAFIVAAFVFLADVRPAIASLRRR
ncbi:DUF2516 family protein [Nocardioides sp.]|uniref:DUF2516 family protein n=1 Tax=Nocardioides sp. TaxID=35761 RepID=UPI00351261B2